MTGVPINSENALYVLISGIYVLIEGIIPPLTNTPIPERKSIPSMGVAYNSLLLLVVTPVTSAALDANRMLLTCLCFPLNTHNKQPILTNLTAKDHIDNHSDYFTGVLTGMDC